MRKPRQDVKPSIGTRDFTNSVGSPLNISFGLYWYYYGELYIIDRNALFFFGMFWQDSIHQQRL